MLRLIPLAIVLILAGCSFAPFQTSPPVTSPDGSQRPTDGGAGPVITDTSEVAPPSTEEAVEQLPPVQLPKERPRTQPATLSPASRALVTQAESQRQRGDLPGATISLERALRIEPNNPLLWIEMGKLRMDQRNYPQAENMGRKALLMSVGDDRSQAAAWQLIGESLQARGRNPEAQAAFDRAREFSPR